VQTPAGFFIRRCDALPGQSLSRALSSHSPSAATPFYRPRWRPRLLPLGTVRLPEGSAAPLMSRSSCVPSPAKRQQGKGLSETMAAALGTREILVVLQPRNSHEIAFLPSLDLAAGIDQRIGSARLGTPSLGAVCRVAKENPGAGGWDCGYDAASFHRHDDGGSDWFCSYWRLDLAVRLGSRHSRWHYAPRAIAARRSSASRRPSGFWKLCPGRSLSAFENGGQSCLDRANDPFSIRGRRGRDCRQPGALD
jgi:hypothetical protein